MELGPVSLTGFPSQFKFDGNIFSLSPRFEYSDCYKILCMAWQLCCHGMCKNLLRSDGQQRIMARGSFHPIWIAGKKPLVKWAPAFHVLKWSHLGLLNMKMSLYQFRISHFESKMVIQLSYFHNGISCSVKTTSLVLVHTCNSRTENQSQTISSSSIQLFHSIHFVKYH